MLCLLAGASFAGKAYHIKVKLRDTKDTTIFLCHYYGVTSPYKRDSAKLVNGIAEFSSSDSSFAGGIYMIFLPGKNTEFDMLLNKGDDISVIADAKDFSRGVVFKNSPENDRFENYVDYLAGYGKQQKELQDELGKATTLKDTENIRARSADLVKGLENYRMDYVSHYPGTLLSNIFNAMKQPEVPKGDHFLEDGKTKDSVFAYNYYKSHFWDGFNLRDDRLIYTPLYDARLDEYFNKLVVPHPDSVEREADMLLQKTKGTRDLFKYSLWWLTRYAENSKIMGMDEVFVYLVENYYMKGDAYWLKPDELQKYIDRAFKIAPNLLYHVAPEIQLDNVMTKKAERLSAVDAPYTLVIFYSPDCGHCQHEMPLLDSLYTAVLKARGIKVFTISTESTREKINDFIRKNHMETWTNTWDPENHGNWRSMYDVYSTPTIYLLDKQKKIIGKRIDHTNITKVMEGYEKKLQNESAPHPSRRN